jgi:methionine aminopeptidase
VCAIGEAVVEVAQRHKLQVSRDFIGHGVGRVFHARPHVQHVKNNDRDKMLVGGAVCVWGGALGWARSSRGPKIAAGRQAEQIPPPAKAYGAMTDT